MKEVTIGDYEFPMMAEIIPEQDGELYYIHHKTATEKEAEHKRRMSAFSFSGQGYIDFKAGTWCILQKKGGFGDGAVLMSDTIMERRSNYYPSKRANGHVLLGGLGIGLIPTKIAPYPRVESITVLEIEPEIIRLVEPHIRSYLDGDSDKLRIIQADAYEWQPDRKFDTMYMDIWQSICSDNWDDMKRLNKHYRKWLNRENPAAFIEHWQQDYCKSEYYKARRDNRWR